MENQVRLQHYVPKVYLKNFSNKSKGKHYVQCFDKQTGKMFPVNIEKIAHEEKFYDRINETQETERSLREIETKFGKAVNNLIATKDISKLCNKDFEDILEFITAQSIRTKETRLVFEQAAKQFLEKFGGELSNKLKKEAEESMKKENLRKTHKKFILEDRKTFREIIKKMKWILIVNKSIFPFWTSDNPVVKYNSINHSPYGNLGLTKTGIEVYFPINPKLCLLICDPLAFHMEPNKKVTRDYRHIIKIRDLQVRESTRFIFSADSNFNFAKIVLKENPELKDPERKRVKVN